MVKSRVRIHLRAVCFGVILWIMTLCDEIIIHVRTSILWWNLKTSRTLNRTVAERSTGLTCSWDWNRSLWEFRYTQAGTYIPVVLLFVTGSVLLGLTTQCSILPSPIEGTTVSDRPGALFSRRHSLLHWQNLCSAAQTDEPYALHSYITRYIIGVITNYVSFCINNFMSHPQRIIRT
jgi:hypothetical protein